VNDAPNFLVEWSSPWQEFRTAIGPALSRSEEPLSGEAPVGLFPYRGFLVGWLFEGVLLILLILLSQHLAEMRSLQPPAMIKPDVIYFTGNELPRTEDAGGTRAGRSGRGGGRQAHHPTQTIRVARGELLRERVVDAPKLNLPRSESAVANLLAYKAIPGPVPAEGLKSSARAPQLEVQAIAPAPELKSDNLRAARTLNAGVVPPAPAAPQRDLPAPRIPGNQTMQVVPPPVSAPEKFPSENARLTLLAPAVVAPPPQITRERVTPGPGFGAGEATQIVPPPAQVANNVKDRRTFAGMGTNNAVVPPAAQLNDGSIERRASAGLAGSAAVVPPTVQLNGGSIERLASAELAGSATVVPPSPTISGGSSQARGTRGMGLGSPSVAGVAAPAKDTGGSTAGAGVVVSSQPGATKGVPRTSTGALALSPSGGSTPGLGGSGGGSSIGRGTDSGSGLSGKDAGAGKTDNGRGSDTLARSGISPYPGTGGAGNGTTSKPSMPGVSVRGGSNIVTLPSFGGGAAQPVSPGKSTTNKDDRPGIMVVASSRSGGAFNFYGTLKGDKVYTIYIDTNLGTAVMEFADPDSVGHGGEDLTAPRPMRASVSAPADMKRSRLVIACVLDRAGIVKNAHVLEPGAVEMTTKVMAALPSWKFSPALRGSQPVEVNAILGFEIDTR